MLSFWPGVYNNYNMTEEELLRALNSRDPTVKEYVEKMPEAFKYVWARMQYCSKNPSLLYW